MEQHREIDASHFVGLMGQILDIGVPAKILETYGNKNRKNPDALAEATRLARAINQYGGFLKLPEEDKQAMRVIAHSIFPPQEPQKPFQQRLPI